MDDLDKYIQKRKKKDPKFAEGYASGYQEFLIGALLKEARTSAGITRSHHSYEEISDFTHGESSMRREGINSAQSGSSSRKRTDHRTPGSFF